MVLILALFTLGFKKFAYFTLHTTEAVAAHIIDDLEAATHRSQQIAIQTHRDSIFDTYLCVGADGIYF